MKILDTAIPAAAMAIALLAASPASSQDSKVYAVIDGTKITESDMEQARQSFAQALQRVPEAQRQGILLNALIEAHLLSAAAQADGLDQSAGFKDRLAWMRRQALRDVYVKHKISSKVSDADVQARYEKVIGGQPAETEMHARHILVKSEDQARAIIKELDGGADFVALAKAKSTGPSGLRGGDLGFFGKGRMVPEFEAAAFALKPGQHSATPVKSQFGWHIIKAEELREKPKPSFESVKGRVREAILAERLQKILGGLRAKSKIEIK